MTYATTLNNSIGGALDDVKIFEAYIQKCLFNSIHGNLRSHRKDQIKDEILAGISTLSDIALEEWVDAIDATVRARCIGVRALQRMRARSEMIPRDRVWMLYDPCVTTKWRDEETANRFQEFVRGIQGWEQTMARNSRHACAKRRRELLERACTQPRGRMGELIDRVAGLFATGLLMELNTASRIESSANLPDDWELVKSGGSGTLSGLFAKWTPTPNGMHDKALGIASLIHKKLVEHLREDGNQILREEMLRSSGVPIEHLSLQRDFLTPLRRAAEIPEHFIGAGTASGGVNYSRMASRCRMIFGEKVFRKLDRVNYDKYVLDAAKANLLRQLHPFCKDGKIVKVNAGVLLPHELVLKAVKAQSSPLSIARVEVQLQWQGLLDSFAQPVTSVSRRLIIPMCDVSGSMSSPCGDSGDGKCMDVACALSLLLTDLLPEGNIFRGRVLTFSESPTFVTVKTESNSALTIEAVEAADSLDSIAALLPDLAGRVRTLKGSDWGMSTNFFGAMERICDVAKEHNLTSEDVKGLELVVFSDMEFNEAQYGANYNEKTMLNKIRQLFVDRFGPAAAAHPPKIVFWNLRPSTSGSGVAENAGEEDVALLSGFSAGLLRKYLTWDFVSSDIKEVPIGGERAGRIGVHEADEGKMTPIKAMLACLEDPLYNNLRLEKDLEEWEALVSEEEIMKRAEMVRGENSELVHTSNSSALVAFFFEAVPGIEANALEGMLDASFKENPLIALKLMFNLGSVRKSTAGKADRENFQLGLLWLWRTWPETYLLNISSIAKFASLKELLNSAMFILYEGECERDPVNYALYSLAGQKKALKEHRMRKKCRNDKVRRKCRKMQRLKVWCDFARSVGKDLFGELRVEHDFTHKLGELKPKVKKYPPCRNLNPEEEMDDYFLMDGVKNAAGGKVALRWKGSPRIPKRKITRGNHGYHRPSEKRSHQAEIKSSLD